jgi:hypothetical protein
MSNEKKHPVMLSDADLVYLLIAIDHYTGTPNSTHLKALKKKFEELREKWAKE